MRLIEDSFSSSDSAENSAGTMTPAKRRMNTVERKRQILDRVTAAEGLERYLQAKYVGQKRFSLEGGESFIACMDELIRESGAKGVQEIVIGMAQHLR